MKGPGNLYIRSPPKHQKKHMNANRNMIGYLAIYSHLSSPNIVIEPRKERLSQKKSYYCESTRDFY